MHPRHPILEAPAGDPSKSAIFSLWRLSQIQDSSTTWKPVNSHHLLNLGRVLRSGTLVPEAPEDFVISVILSRFFVLDALTDMEPLRSFRTNFLRSLTLLGVGGTTSVPNSRSSRRFGQEIGHFFTLEAFTDTAHLQHLETS